MLAGRDRSGYNDKPGEDGYCREAKVCITQARVERAIKDLAEAIERENQ